MNAHLTVMVLLVIGAFVCTLVSAAGKIPVWVPMLLLCLIAALQAFPIK